MIPWYGGSKERQTQLPRKMGDSEVENLENHIVASTAPDFIFAQAKAESDDIQSSASVKIFDDKCMASSSIYSEDDEGTCQYMSSYAFVWAH